MSIEKRKKEDLEKEIVLKQALISGRTTYINLKIENEGYSQMGLEYYIDSLDSHLEWLQIIS